VAPEDGYSGFAGPIPRKLGMTIEAGAGGHTIDKIRAGQIQGAVDGGTAFTSVGFLPVDEWT